MEKEFTFIIIGIVKAESKKEEVKKQLDDILSGNPTLELSIKDLVVTEV